MRLADTYWLDNQAMRGSSVQGSRRLAGIRAGFGLGRGGPRAIHRGFVLLLWLAGCRADGCIPEADREPSRAGPARRVVATSLAPMDASDFEFDAFQLGDLFADDVKARTPYLAPCKVEVLARSKRRLVLYGPERCGEQGFPDGSIAAFFLDDGDARLSLDRDQRPVVAFAWFGGSWFTSRSDFPLDIGAPDASASATFGQPRHIFELHRRSSPRALITRGHPRDVWSLSDGRKLVGFVAGPMPPFGDDEQWQALLRFYEEHGARR